MPKPGVRPISPKQWIKPVLVGAALVTLLAAPRVAFISRDYGGVFGYRWQVLLLIAAIGGLGGLIFHATRAWRRAGLGLVATFSLIGAAAANVIFVLLVLTEEGNEYGLAEATILDWLVFYVGAVLIGVVAGACSGAYFEHFGILDDDK